MGSRVDKTRTLCKVIVMTTKTMKAVVHDRYGPPEVLRLEEVERPVPKDDEVLGQDLARRRSRGRTRTCAAKPFIWRSCLGLRRPKARSSASSSPARWRPSAPPSRNSVWETGCSASETGRMPSTSAWARAPAGAHARPCDVRGGGGGLRRLLPGVRTPERGGGREGYAARRLWRVDRAGRRPCNSGSTTSVRTSPRCNTKNVDLVRRWGRTRSSITSTRTSRGGADV